MAESTTEDKSPQINNPILHIVVVGFHHKKGCQVDFSYPPLIDGRENNSSELPAEWKHLPFLALPDGAHNYQEDTIYFHLPGREEKRCTVYGVSCYRQIDTKDLLSKNKEYTRGTVQKSVCVLSKLPLYGLIQAKLKLITHAYFSERDFSKTSVLTELYTSLNGSLTTGQLDSSQAFLDLPLRDLILTFKHKVLVLFKLLLLERRVLFFAQPVHMLCTSLLSLVSLFPAMLEHGLVEAASYRYYRPPTPNLELTDFGIDAKEYDDVKMSQVPNYRRNNKKKPRPKGRYITTPSPTSGISDGTSSSEKKSTDSNTPITASKNIPVAEDLTSSGKGTCDAKTPKNCDRETAPANDDIKVENSRLSLTSAETDLMALIDQELYGTFFEGRKLSEKSDDDSGVDKTSTERGSSSQHPDSTHRKESQPESNDCEVFTDPLRPAVRKDRPDSLVLEEEEKRLGRSTDTTREETIHETIHERLSSTEDFVVVHSCPSACTIRSDDFGFPLSLFGKGSLCHPYMSLQQHDLLQDVNVRCFLIGASNMLFKQRRHLIDVLVEVEEGKVAVFDTELRKQLSLSTADLRFADFLIKTVSEKSEDIYLDGTSWEGGDEWIRAQFKVYTLSLLATSQHCTHDKYLSDFNEQFANAWKTTHNYRIWMSREHPGIDFIHAGHPFQGQLSMNDMKIRLQSAMQTTDRGKKLNSALNRTGVAVLHTSKAVGGALSSAKTAVTSWITGLASE